MDYYIGEIRIFAGNYAPQGWHLCDGSLLSINENQALFSLIGQIYGGDGIKTFGLPDLQGRLVVGTDQLHGGIKYGLGQKGGNSEVQLTQSTMPTHNHLLIASTDQATTGIPTGNMPAASAPAGNGYTTVNLYAALPTGTTTPDAPLDPSVLVTEGESQPHENMMPYVTINYIISLGGIYPTPD